MRLRPLAAPVQPDRDCPACPRLVALRQAQRALHGDWHNAPVASFGPASARLLVVGLAPGMQGANRTGRPFTGDYAGGLLYATLIDFGFAAGRYDARPDDGLELIDCRITNAVRCVPPQNKPTGEEARTCRPFLEGELGLASLRAVVALGRVAHDNVLAALALRKAHFPFAHGAMHELGPGIRLFDSYHCSRYNTNTGVLTVPMFRQVFAKVRDHLDGA